MGTRVGLAFGLLGLALACTCGPQRTSNSDAPVVTASSASPGTLPEADARHLLRRASFGAAPGDVEHAVELGLEGWLTEQLDPKGADPELERAIEPYKVVLGPPEELLREFRRGKDDDEVMEEMELGKRADVDKSSLLRALHMLELSRHIASRLQLREVMADFWANHFNVLGGKGSVAPSTPDYLEGIRARSLGRFADLLRFTAQHPAMLFYLDNASSVALMGKEGTEKDRFRGLNENYARELLELHTLGVTGGYTQDDVRETARVLTGWSVDEQEDGKAVFAFHTRKHDTGTKTVLGATIEDNGKKEGEDLLLVLSRHPATAQHLATKLCRRFVSDEPPKECIETTAQAYLASDGDIAETLRALFRSPSFWADSARGQKFKTPVEFVVSAARVLGARPDGSVKLARRVFSMGEGLFLYPAPTGHPEVMSEWLSGGALLARFDLAAALVRGGAGLEPVEDLAEGRDVETQLQAAEQRVLGERAGDATRQAAREELEAARGKQRRLIAVALMLGSPEFQHQ